MEKLATAANTTCKGQAECDIATLRQAFDAQAASARRQIADAKRSWWKMLQRHNELLQACRTPEEIDAAMAAMVGVFAAD